MCILVSQAKCLWGTKAADLWLELRPDMLHYSSIAMKMPADASAPAAAEPAGEQGASLAASEAGSEKGESDPKPKSPKKKRRRFQPKRSPKKRACRNKPDPTLAEECEADDENKESESDLEG